LTDIQGRKASSNRCPGH